MKEFKVLQVEAWADDNGDGEGNRISWSWNNWWHVETFKEECHGLLTEESAKTFFFNEMFTANTHTNNVDEKLRDFLELYEIEDDQYNLVLIKKDNGMPIYAIEYGSHY